MTIPLYRIARKLKPTGVGASDSYLVELSAFAKQNGQNAPYCIPNEYICGELGRFLGLPIPPVGLMAIKDAGKTDEIWFASLDFNFTGTSLPPVDPDTCIKELPWVATGLIVFDILVANSDRHRGNLAIDATAKPPKMSVFDHSHALLGWTAGQGKQRLFDLRDRLGITQGGKSGGNRHCLIDKLVTAKFFQEWIDRVQGIPDFFVNDICLRVVNLGATQEEIEAAREFLKYRKNNIATIISAHQSEFKSIMQWELLI